MSETTFVVSPGPAISLASGAPAAAGEQVKVDPVAKDNTRHIASGRLVAISGETKLPTKAELLSRAKSLDIEGRSSMNVDELQAAIAEAESAQAEKE